VQIGFVTTTRQGRSSCRTASSRCGTRTAMWWKRRNSPARPRLRDPRAGGDLRV